ncbi:hypothetical protein HPB47_019853 [Ixodes persulcatus]|uniref:Uncharacterized protein n=1 Tax=Ixodes persulcatus TaxID=34615 RepID=A0AC60QJJ9_IXOPE|nr:hypothetical protein HPB47_019853 [Ixodes persulcatus]
MHDQPECLVIKRVQHTWRGQRPFPSRAYSFSNKAGNVGNIMKTLKCVNLRFRGSQSYVHIGHTVFKPRIRNRKFFFFGSLRVSVVHEAGNVFDEAFYALVRTFPSCLEFLGPLTSLLTGKEAADNGEALAAGMSASPGDASAQEAAEGGVMELDGAVEVDEGIAAGPSTAACTSHGSAFNPEAAEAGGVELGSTTDVAGSGAVETSVETSVDATCSKIQSCGQAPAWNPFAQLFAQPSALSTTEPAAESA